MPFRCYDKLREVPRVPTVTEEEFFWRYMWPNLPVVIGPALLQSRAASRRPARCVPRPTRSPWSKSAGTVSLTDPVTGVPTWAALREWATPDGKPNLALLRDRYGDVEVPVVECTYGRAAGRRIQSAGERP